MRIRSTLEWIDGCLECAAVKWEGRAKFLYVESLVAQRLTYGQDDGHHTIQYKNVLHWNVPPISVCKQHLPS